MTKFGFETTANEVTELFANQIKGKIILITGVSPNSLGAEAAISLSAAKPELIILASRSSAKIQETASKITECKTLAVVVDLSSISSVRAVVAALDVPRIDILINNAATMACPYATTVDGFETQFGTNHIGHFVLTNALIEKGLLKQSNEGTRIVNLASMAYTASGIRWWDIGFGGGKNYESWQAYGQSKTANMLFTRGLAKQGWVSLAVHPGGILTNLARSVSLETINGMAAVIPGFKFKNHQQGAAGSIVAAFEPTLKNGSYLNDCQEEEVPFWASSDEQAEKLWKLTEELIAKAEEKKQ